MSTATCHRADLEAELRAEFEARDRYRADLEARRRARVAATRPTHAPAYVPAVNTVKPRVVEREMDQVTVQSTSRGVVLCVEEIEVGNDCGPGELVLTTAEAARLRDQLDAVLNKESRKEMSTNTVIIGKSGSGLTTQSRALATQHKGRVVALVLTEHHLHEWSDVENATVTTDMGVISRAADLMDARRRSSDFGLNDEPLLLIIDPADHLTAEQWEPIVRIVRLGRTAKVWVVLTAHERRFVPYAVSDNCETIDLNTVPAL